ncbi:hypothetical protein K8R43_00925 [archaeon]|nr:hypothetical protein [archaeon]
MSFYSDPFKETPKPIKSSKEQLTNAIINAVQKDCQDLTRAGLLFSGGVDSTLLAVLLKKQVKTQCYCAGLEGSADMQIAPKIAEQLDIPLKTIQITPEQLEQELPAIIALVGQNKMKVGVATPFYFCMRNAKEKTFFSGLGTEELYAGYARHWKNFEETGWPGVEQERIAGLKTMWERDLTRDQAIAKAFNKELKTPFLDQKVVARSLGIPAQEMKKGTLKKQVLREIALGLGVPSDSPLRPKKAPQ